MTSSSQPYTIGGLPAPQLPAAGATLSVSGVDPRRATVDEICAVSERLRGVTAVRGAGAPACLLRPVLAVNGVDVSLDGAFHATLVADCWPRLEANVGDLQLSITVVCSPRSAGLLYHVALRATRELEVCFGVDVAVSQIVLALTSARPLGHALFCAVDPGDRTLLIEALGGAEGLAAGFSVAEIDASMRLVVEGEAEPPTVPVTSVRPNDGAQPLAAHFTRTCALSAGTQQELNLFAVLAPEREGARAAVVAMRHAGPARLSAEAEQEARRLLLRLPSLPPSADSRLGQRYRQNALFCYNFSSAETIDTGRTVPIISRSGHSPLCGLTIEREILLWALPVITWLNPRRARALLQVLCEQHARPTADAVRYLDGIRFAPGFLLDNLCAYPIALSRYVTTTGDRDILGLPQVSATLAMVRGELATRRHRDLALYRTELTPSGQPASHPYLTFCNALVWRALVDLGWIGAESRHRDHAVAEEIRHAVYQELIDHERGGFLFATDLAGDTARGDDPAGTLLWLPALGFCREDDPVFARTVEVLFAADSPERVSGRFPGLRWPGVRGAAAFAALGPTLFCSRAAEALAVVSSAPLADGLACDAYDAESGTAVAGQHRATVAGLLAWALAESRALVE